MGILRNKMGKITNKNKIMYVKCLTHKEILVPYPTSGLILE